MFHSYDLELREVKISSVQLEPVDVSLASLAISIGLENTPRGKQNP